MILSVLSHHKTDAIFRVYNTDRYDDRDVIITNLLDSYDRLMSFGKRPHYCTIKIGRAHV